MRIIKSKTRETLYAFLWLLKLLHQTIIVYHKHSSHEHITARLDHASFFPQQNQMEVLSQSKFPDSSSNNKLFIVGSLVWILTSWSLPFTKKASPCYLIICIAYASWTNNHTLNTSCISSISFCRWSIFPLEYFSQSPTDQTNKFTCYSLRLPHITTTLNSQIFGFFYI